MEDRGVDSEGALIALSSVIAGACRSLTFFCVLPSLENCGVTTSPDNKTSLGETSSRDRNIRAKIIQSDVALCSTRPHIFKYLLSSLERTNKKETQKKTHHALSNKIAREKSKSFRDTSHV